MHHSWRSSHVGGRTDLSRASAGCVAGAGSCSCSELYVAFSAAYAMMPVHKRDRALTAVSRHDTSLKTPLLKKWSSMCHSPQCFTHLMAGLVRCEYTCQQMRNSIC